MEKAIELVHHSDCRLFPPVMKYKFIQVLSVEIGSGIKETTNSTFFVETLNLNHLLGAFQRNHNSLVTKKHSKEHI